MKRSYLPVLLLFVLAGCDRGASFKTRIQPVVDEAHKLKAVLDNGGTTLQTMEAINAFSAAESKYQSSVTLEDKKQEAHRKLEVLRTEVNRLVQAIHGPKIGVLSEGRLARAELETMCACADFIDAAK